MNIIRISFLWQLTSSSLYKKLQSSLFCHQCTTSSHFLPVLQLEKLGEEEDEEDEPAIEQRRECTDLGLDVGEKEEHVVCHASALALAMTDEAHREAEM